MRAGLSCLGEAGARAEPAWRACPLAARSDQGLVDQVAQHLAIAQANETWRRSHKHHRQLLLRVDPEVGAVDPRPIKVAGAAGHGGNATLSAHGEAQTKAVAHRRWIHAVCDPMAERWR